jgi:hypothetical protein
MSLILSGSDGLSDIDGTAATPAIRGTDANTGIFFPAADTIAFSEGGAESMRIDSSGNVGIGTSSPTQPLTIGGNGNILATAGATWFSGGDLYIRAGTSGNLRFGANNSNDLLTLNTTGTLILNGADTTANGSGVTFPATQNASSNANTLDDYEEGTWTPSLGGTTTYSSQLGQYVKVGRLVYATFDVIVNLIGTGSNSTITGLPFVGGGIATGMAGPVAYWDGANAALTTIMLRVDSGSTSISTASTAGNQTTSTNGANIFKNSTRLLGTAIYFANS